VRTQMMIMLIVETIFLVSVAALLALIIGWAGSGVLAWACRRGERPSGNLDQADSWRSDRCQTKARNKHGFLLGGSFASPGPRIAACTA